MVLSTRMKDPQFCMSRNDNVQLLWEAIICYVCWNKNKMTLSETRKEEKDKKDEHTPKEQTKNSALQGISLDTFAKIYFLRRPSLPCWILYLKGWVVPPPTGRMCDPKWEKQKIFKLVLREDFRHRIVMLLYVMEAQAFKIGIKKSCRNFNNLKELLSAHLEIQYLSVWQVTHWVLRYLEYKLKINGWKVVPKRFFYGSIWDPFWLHSGQQGLEGACMDKETTWCIWGNHF